jgi:hypothetical protein
MVLQVQVPHQEALVQAEQTAHLVLLQHQEAVVRQQLQVLLVHLDKMVLRVDWFTI